MFNHIMGAIASSQYIPSVSGETISGNYSTNLEAYWSCDTSGTFLDRTANDNDGTINGATFSSGNGIIGSAYSFDGINDTISGTADWTDHTTGTINLWFKCATADNTSEYGSRLFTYFVSASERIEFLLIDDSGTGKLGLYIQDTSVVVWDEDITSYSDNTWTMFSIVQDGTNIKAYKNGVFIKNTVTSSKWIKDFANTGGFHFCSYGGGGYYYNGLLDEIGVWKEALSADDLLAIYNSGSGIPYD